MIKEVKYENKSISLRRLLTFEAALSLRCSSLHDVVMSTILVNLP